MVVILYAGILGLFYFWLSLEVIKQRRSKKISLGVGPDKEIEKVVSAHTNFSQYAPVLLVLLFMLEGSGKLPSFLIHLGGMSIVAGRYLHYRGIIESNFKLRPLGMKLTLWPVIIFSATLIVLYFVELFA